ncbi:hypothetical protein [Streptomyces sp. NPDC097610]|uniref:hypothetical protein n=1 Tax=Streptomyces sp. NPDC097610 TaxID=3157227 RepID=UPI003330CFB1
MNAEAAHTATAEETVRCPGCGLQKPLLAGAVVDHYATRVSTAHCWGSGARRRTAAERDENRREWAQALATGGWSQMLEALRARTQRDKHRPVALRDDPYPLLPAVRDDEPAVVDSPVPGEQLALFATA